MNHDTADLAPTSTATTSQTEPAVVAGVASAKGGPDLRLSIRVGGAELRLGWMLLLLGAGAVLGYGAVRLLRRPGQRYLFASE